MNSVLPTDYLFVFFILVPVVVAAFKRFVLSRELKVLTGWLIVHFILDYIATFVIMDNKYIADMINIVDFIAFSILFICATKKRIFRRVILLLLLPLVIFYIVNIISNASRYFTEAGSFAFYTATFAYCIMYFRELLQSEPIFFLDKKPMFWVTSGIFISTSGIFVVTMFGNYLAGQDESLFIKYWQISNFSNLVSYILYTIAMLCYRK